MFNPYAVSTDYASWIVPFGALKQEDFDSKGSELMPVIEAMVTELKMQSLYKKYPTLVFKVLGMIFEYYKDDITPQQLQEVEMDYFKSLIKQALEVLETTMKKEDAEAEAKKKAEAARKKKSADWAAELTAKVEEEKRKKAEEAEAARKKAAEDWYNYPDTVDTKESSKQAKAAHQAEKDRNQNERNAAAVIAQDALRKRNEGIRSGSGSGASGEPDRPYKNPTEATTNYGKNHKEMQVAKLGHMSRNEAFNILNNFTRLFYDQCEKHFKEDYETLETNTNELRSLSHHEGHEDLSKTAHAIIQGRWDAAIAEWLKKYPKNNPGRFLHGIDKTRGMPSNEEAGLAYFIEGHFPGAWNDGDSIKMTFGRHLFEMKRYFIERLIAAKVEREFDQLDNSSRDSTFRQKGLIKYRFSKEYLQDQREKLQKAGQIEEGGKGRFYDKHRTAVQLQTEVVNGKKKRKPASSRKRLAGIYAALHKAEGRDKRYAGMSKDGKSEIWWGEKAQTDWLFLA